MNEDWDKRLKKLTMLVGSIFLVLALVLAGLQLGPASLTYARLADRNRIRILTIPAPRGEIRDRYGRSLATNHPSFSLSLLFLGWDEVKQSAARLGELLGLDPAAIEARVKAQGYRLYEPVRILEDLTPEQQSLVEEHGFELPGVVVEVRPRRLYPLGSTAAHVLGYLREIDQGELGEKAPQGYRLGDMVGRAGVEYVLESVLRGKDGGRQVEVNYRGFPVRAIPPATDPIPGKDVVLTLDARLQAAAEQALDSMARRLQEGPGRKYPGAKSGAVVAIDPNNGDVLALVSYPAFDPNAFSRPMSREEWARLTGPERPLWNRAISGTYAPGSTFKMVTAVAALMEGKVSPREAVYCSGIHPVTAGWSHPKRCWARTGHGSLNMEGAIARSCDVYFYEMARRTGVDAIARWGSAFGLGQRSGIELPGESAGTLASTAYKKWAYEAKAKDGSRLFPWIPTAKWQYPAEDMDAAIGQGFTSVTPLQMAQYAATIANGGIRYRPQIVKEIRAGKTVVQKTTPVEEGRVELPAEVWDTVRRGMRAVTAPGGTAGGVFAGFPVEVAGKTGTAENPHGDDHAWFVCYAPYSHPSIALAVLIEQGGHGTAAAAVARDILTAYFEVAAPQVSQTTITSGE